MTLRAALFSAVVASLAVGSVGCDDESAPGGPFALTFRGTAFDPHEGSTLHAAVVDAATGDVVARGQATVAGGAFSIAFPGALEAGPSYRVDYYADVDADGECDAPPGDHVWRETFGTAQRDLVLEVVHDLDFTPEACESFPVEPGAFALTFAASHFDVHEGLTFAVAVVDARDRVVVRASTVIVGGRVDLYFGGILLAGETYRVDYFVDFDADGGCSGPPADHVWRRSVASVTADATLAVMHDFDFAPEACEHFPEPLPRHSLAYTGSGYHPHDGQTFHLAVVDAATGAVVVEGSTTVADGGISFTFPGALVEGRAYSVDSYADFNESGTCEPPPTDHTWREEIPAVDGDVVIVRDHDFDFEPAACERFPRPSGRFDLAIDGTGYHPHEGQALSYVVWVADMSAMAAYGSTTVVEGGFAVRADEALEAGRAYVLDYYVDFDANGACEPPPADHVWREEIPEVWGDVALDLVHDFDFTPEACDSF